MAVRSIRQSELPGASPLFRDWVKDFAKVGSFYAHPPSVEGALAAASEVSLPAGRRKRLVDELAGQNGNGGAATAASLDRLSAPGTVVVATGQQVGLLGGPVFTLYKALTAVRLAEELTRRGTPAVPVFWLATEDHDLDEVNHAWAFDHAGQPHRIECVTEGPVGDAVDRMSVTDAGLDAFASFSERLPFADESLRLARGAYSRPGGFGSSFQALYRKILAGTGMVFLSPMSDGIRRLAAPLVKTSIDRAAGLTGLLLRRERRLADDGYHSQVRFRASSSLLMAFEDAGRRPLHRRNGAYWIGSRSWSTGELLARAEDRPSDLSPTALLRPVIQDFLLPTAAIVVGPSEAAYLAQSAVLYEDLLGRMPAVVPRESFTIVDTGCAKLLKRHGLEPDDCWVGRRDLDAAIAKGLVPAALRGTLESQADRIGSAMQRIEEGLLGFDPTLSASFRRSMAKIEYQLGRIRLKVEREALRRSDTARRHAAKLSGFLYPRGHLQERLYSVLSFIARFGTDFADRVRQAAEPGSGRHKVLEL